MFDKALGRRHRLRAFFVIAVITLTISMCQSKPTPTPTITAPIHVQTTPWRVGEEVQLTIRCESNCDGQTISLTILVPGAGQPQIENISSKYFGLSGVQFLWLPPEQRELDAALAAAAGAQYIGLDFDWRRIEPVPGNYDWKDVDQVVALAKEYGFQLVPMLLFTPRWASTKSFAPLDYHLAPPANYSDYRNFVYNVVRRYKPNGTSPLTHNGYGIKDWVIWNEPNVHTFQENPEPREFWIGSLEEYILLLRAGYEGAHAADPETNVLNGGLADVFWASGESDLITSLERFYDPDGDGDAGDGARPFFDTLNIHTYQIGKPDASWYQERLDGVLGVMDRFGDEQKAIWITETGYGSTGHDTIAENQLDDEHIQGDAVSMIYRTCATYPQVERVFWWSLRDYYAIAPVTKSAMEAHYGLIRTDWAPKQAFLTYSQLTGRTELVTTMTVVADKDNTAKVEIPSKIITQSGIYTVFITLEDVTTTGVFTYEATAD